MAAIPYGAANRLHQLRRGGWGPGQNPGPGTARSRPLNVDLRGRRPRGNLIPRAGARRDLRLSVLHPGRLGEIGAFSPGDQRSRARVRSRETDHSRTRWLEPPAIRGIESHPQNGLWDGRDTGCVKRSVRPRHADCPDVAFHRPPEIFRADEKSPRAGGADRPVERPADNTAIANAGQGSRQGQGSSRIFASYRREAAEGHILLLQQLREHFGKHRVFKRAGTMEPGQDLAREIAHAQSGSVMLVVIGSALADHQRRQADAGVSTIRRMTSGSKLQRR